MKWKLHLGALMYAIAQWGVKFLDTTSFKSFAIPTISSIKFGSEYWVYIYRKFAVAFYSVDQLYLIGPVNLLPHKPNS